MNMHTDLPAAPLPGLPLDTRLRPALHSGGHLQGLFCGLTLPALVEMAAFARFDFVVIDNEHGLAGFETTEHMLRAARASGIMPIVRCFEADIPRILDAGASGIKVPMIQTPDASEIMSLSKSSSSCDDSTICTPGILDRR